MDKRIFSIILMLVLITSIFTVIPSSVSGWSNGGYSDNPSSPDYGTHDWIAQHALDWLPIEEKQYILDNFNTYLYGTELPDNSGPSDGIGDTATHHVYYNKNGDLTDDSSAVRAETEYDNAKAHLENRNYVQASKYAGIMSHYIVDIGVFGHVMGKSTDWGAEDHHSDYENYVKNRMTDYTSAEFDSYLIFDGSLDSIEPYAATVEIGYLTTFGDNDKLKNCTWMDDNYDWGVTIFMDSCGASLNYSVNYLTDVLHTLAVESGYNGEGGQYNITPKVVFSEVYYDTTGTDADHEYIELYNPTEIAINLANWEIEDNNFPYTILGPATIQPYSYFTLARNGSQFLLDYGFSPDKGDLTLALSNSGDYLKLYNDVGVEIDLVAWEGASPGWDISATEGNTIMRTNPDIDTNSSSDWGSNQQQDPKTQYHGSFPPNQNQPPVASFTTSKDIVNISEEISFDASDSYDLDLDTLSYYWDFNASDGLDDDIPGKTIIHQYSSSGIYVVTLTVVDTKGGWDEKSIHIVVEIPNYPPTAVILYAPLEITNNSIKIHWSQNNDTDFHHYSISIEYGTEFLQISSSDFHQRDTLQYNITRLVSNTTYQISVEVHDDGWLSNESNIINVRTLDDPPQDDNGDNGNGDTGNGDTGNGDTNDGDGNGSQDDDNLTDDKEGSDDYYWIYGLCGILAIIVAVIMLIIGIKRLKKGK